MSFLKFLGLCQKKSAKVARERLQIVLSHQRLGGGSGTTVDFLPELRNELMKVISKYVQVDQDHINVQLQRSEHCSILELNITLPTPELVD